MKKAKIISILAMAMIVMFALTTVVSATIGGEQVKPDETALQNTKVVDAGERILGIMQGVGIIIAIGMVIVIGIKYMMGSAEEKAAYKKTMVPYLIGAIILFAASAIVGAIQNFNLVQ